MGKAEGIVSRNGQVDEKLMKPFTMGWTREVVRRVLAKNPTCDIYYFSPDGKKLRSLKEVNSCLMDGLSLDCFSFKREILGLDLNFEKVRNANCKRKSQQKKGRSKTEVETESQPSVPDVKRRKTEIENSDSSLVKKDEESGGENVGKSDKEEVENNTQSEEVQKSSNESPTSKKKGRNALANGPLSDGEKEISKMVASKETGQIRTSARRKALGEAIKKAASPVNEAVERTSKKGTKLETKAETFGKGEKEAPNADIETESKTKNETCLKSAETETKNKRSRRDLKRNEIQVQSTNAEAAESEGKIEEEQELGSADLKSIVQKNIGKYRKLREKQKLKFIRTQMKRSSSRAVNNSRAESFLKNRSNYLKPLQKGWKRELVYRSNCSKAGLQADVYYFHPSGKKFRSSREIQENSEMIGGLSIEFFTFRKEALGCGEPLEVIRKARISQKH